MQAINQRNTVSYSDHIHRIRMRKFALLLSMAALGISNLVDWFAAFDERLSSGSITKTEICAIIVSGIFLCTALCKIGLIQ